MKMTLAVVAFVGLLILSAPAVRAQDDAAMDPDLITATATPPQTISPADVLKLMQSGDQTKFALVDTQPVDGYADTHITGALSYPWAMRITHFPIALPRDRMLIFYGSCSNDTSETIAHLAEFGYHNVKVMDGGLYKWEELKYPTTGKHQQVAPAPEVSQLSDPHAGHAVESASAK